MLIKSWLEVRPKQWHKRLDFPILFHGFKHSTADKCIYSKFTDRFSVIICFYIDDLPMSSTNREGVSEAKKYLTSRFKLKSLNEVYTTLMK